MRKPYNFEDYMTSEQCLVFAQASNELLKKSKELLFSESDNSVPHDKSIERARANKEAIKTFLNNGDILGNITVINNLSEEADANFIKSFNGDNEKIYKSMIDFMDSLSEQEHDEIRRSYGYTRASVKLQFKDEDVQEQRRKLFAHDFIATAQAVSYYVKAFIGTDYEDVMSDALAKYTNNIFKSEYRFSFTDIPYSELLKSSFVDVQTLIDEDKPKREKGTIAITPQKSVILLDKTSSLVFDNSFPLGEEIDVAMERYGSSKEINVTVKIDFDAIVNDENIKITKELTDYDKAVYEAVSSLWNAGNQYVTTNMIYRAMIGDTKYSSEAAGNVRDEINASITKMNIAHIYIDNDQEYKAYKKYGKFKYDGSSLPMERISFVINGNDVENCIHLLREPPLYSYASAKKQIATVETKLLKCPQGMKLTQQNYAIRSLLMTRIEHFKSQKCRLAHKDTILFQAIYDKAGIEKGSSHEKTQKKRVRDSVKAFLDNFKENKYINDYEITFNGQSPYSIIIK